MRKNHALFVCFYLCFCLIVTAVYGKDPYVRYPAVNSDGSLIAFSYQGDIWTVPVKGGRAYRLTIHEAYESHPIFSPDGSKIAFISNRFGNNDLFTIDTSGSLPKRLTYHSASDTLSDWTANDQLLFSSVRNYQQVEWDSEIHSVGINGGTPLRFLNAFGNEATVSADGTMVAFVRGACRVDREAYRGAANKDIWIYHRKNKTYHQLTRFDGQDFHPVWDGDQLFFISARDGKYNVYKMAVNPDGSRNGDVKRISRFNDDSVRWISVSRSSDTIVLEKGTRLYRLAKDGQKFEKIEVQIGADYRFDPVVKKSYRSNATEFRVSPNGKLIAFVVNGEIFLTENRKEAGVTHNLSRHPFRDQDIAWLDNHSLIFSSDRSGNFDLYLVRSKDPEEKNLFKTMKREVVKIAGSAEEETNPIISPDGSKIAYTVGIGRLVTASIDKNGIISRKNALLDGWSTPMGVVFSPDSRWLAYALEDLNFNSEIFIQPVDGKHDPVNVSMHPRGDFSPTWSRDGSKLAFLSARHNRDDDIWFVWLKKSDWQKTKAEWDDEANQSKKKSAAKKPSASKKSNSAGKDKKKTVIKPIHIDLQGIHERVVQVTRLDGNEGSLAISKDGKTFYFSSRVPGAKGRDIFQIKWDGTKAKKLSRGGINPRGLELGPKGKYIYYLKRGRLARMGCKSGKAQSIPFKARMKQNHMMELQQIFGEAWRTIRDGFYDPDFHGQDMEKLKAKYQKRCLRASTKQDFAAQFNEMLGQLNASHMGLYARSGREETQRIRTGRIGLEVKAVKSGVEITRIVPDSPADRVISKLSVGDRIVRVDGQIVSGHTNFWALMADTADQKVLLAVKNKKGKIREVVIRPKSNLNSELYDEWVRDNRRLVDKYSKGQLGYLHIQGMSMPSFERFERELASAGYGKKGIVIDVRFNGGGWTTDFLMAILNVKQHAYTIPRGAAKSLSEHPKFKDYYPFGVRLPFYAWNKPSIALCNANSYSNAEIFSHAFKTLGLGKLVGKPTFGAVISTGGRGLMGGMYVRRPFRAWYVKASGKNMEWEPAVPDFDVDNAPDNRFKKTDAQLKKACDELMKTIK